MSNTNAAVVLTAASLALFGSITLVSAAPAKPAVKKPAPAAAKPAAAKPAPANAETAAIAQIEKVGGRVGQIAQNDDHLEVSFHLLGAAVNDAALTPLKSLKKVIRLDLGQTGVTDAGLATLKGMTELTDLHLEGTKVSDKGLAQLKDLKALSYLNLYGTEVTDAGLDALSGLTNLKHLYVWQTKVTDAGIAKIKKALPQVEVVSGAELAPKK